MIDLSDLQNNFYPVEELKNGIVRCADELQDKTFYTYFRLVTGHRPSPFLVSENKIDDDFAAMVLATAAGFTVDQLTKTGLSENPYGFTRLLLAPSHYHSELKGRLDAARRETLLCVPAFDAEFSGTESATEFNELRRYVVPTSHWGREVSPKIKFRFDNAHSKASTGDGYVFARFDQAMREIDNLTGVTEGFAEIINFRGAVAEIVWSGPGFTWIPDRNDSQAESVGAEVIRGKLWTFLT